MDGVNLTKREAYALADIIDMNLFDIIRKDTEIDSMEWLYNVLSAYGKLSQYSGYRGLTMDKPESKKDGERDGQSENSAAVQ